DSFHEPIPSCQVAANRPTRDLGNQCWSYRRWIRPRCSKLRGVGKRLWLHRHFAPFALRRQPFIELRRHDAARRRLLARRPRREMIRVLVLGMTLVSPNPMPAHLMIANGLHRVDPQLEVENRSLFLLPPP